ncbi:MAG: hypothetical protein ACRDSH_20560 [Pseudonocardiaceae bacterium]
MTTQAAVLILLACLCLGMLLGTAWTAQALQPKLRRQAVERRKLNAEWQAVRDSRHSARLVRCPRCGCPLSQGAWYPEEEDDDPDDDD